MKIGAHDVVPRNGLDAKELASDRASRSLGRDPSLDGMRALAAMWVLMTHASYSGLTIARSINFKGSGRAGVLLFFFLSAFLLSGPFLEDHRRIAQWRQWAGYVIRRLTRIVPLYYLVLLIEYLLGIGIFGRPGNLAPAATLVDHLTFRKGESVFWSLVVEMRFYVVFPVVVVVVAAFHRWRRGAAVLVGIVVLWVTASATGALGGTLATLGVDKHAPVFVLGVLTRALLTRTPTFSTGGKNVLEGAAWALAIAGVVLSMPALWSGMPAADYSATSAEYERFWNQRIPWIGFLMGAFFFCCAHGRGAMRGLLSSKPLVALGKLGFGIYLVHEPFIAASAKAPLHDVWKLGLALCLTVISSGILFRFFEEPIMEWGRRLSARLTPMRSG